VMMYVLVDNSLHIRKSLFFLNCGSMYKAKERINRAIEVQNVKVN